MELSQHREEAGLRVSPAVTVPAGLLGFSYSRSGGPGGQNVNKLATRVTLRVGLADLRALIGEAASVRLRHLAGSRVTDAGELIINDEQTRSQQMNREACRERLRGLLLAALTPPQPRRRTKPSRGAKARRLEGKRRDAQVKQSRRGAGEGW
jgi:ribosome-associated protein